MTRDYLRQLFVLLDGEGALYGLADVTGLFTEYAEYPRAISLALPLPDSALQSLEEGPTPAYYAAYQDLNARLNDLSARMCVLLQEAGWPSKAFPATVSQQQLEALGDRQTAMLAHKTVATRAGLGWIGKSAVLVTRHFGPRIRLASVLTLAPLPTARPIDKHRCGTCRRCVEACPAGAILGNEWCVGVSREALVDISACANTAHTLTRMWVGVDDTVCGVCLAVCPVGKKDR